MPRSADRHTPARLDRAIHACQTVSLALFAGAAAATGVVAALAFPTMKDLAVTLPGAATDPADHWRLAAGAILNPAFRLVLPVSIASVGTWLLAVALAAEVAIRARRRTCTRPAASTVRTFAVAVLIAASLWAAPAVNAFSEQFESTMSLAAAGDGDAIDRQRVGSESLHARISSAVTVQLLAALIAAGAAAYAGPPHRARQADADPDAGAASA